MPEPRWYPYVGGRAQNYEATRRESPTWDAEDKALKAILADVPRGSSVLDIPVGTGRFLGLYRELGLEAVGMDISDEMLALAHEKDPDADLSIANVLDIPLPDKSVDVAVCVRLLYFLRPLELARAFKELQRVARRSVIVTAHVGPVHFTPARGPIVHALTDVLAAGGALSSEALLRRRGRGMRYAMLAFDS